MPRAKGSPHCVELAGQKFGEWTVLRRVSIHFFSGLHADAWMEHKGRVTKAIKKG